MLSDDLASSERYRAKYFESVITGLIQIQERPALCAVRYDDTLPPNSKLSWQDVEFKVDVERATHAALDSVGLFPTWLAMLNGEAVPVGRRAKVTDRCACVYIRRKLLPYLYFKPKRLRIRRPDRKTAA